MIDGSDKIRSVVWVVDFVFGSIKQSTTQLYCPVHSSMSYLIHNISHHYTYVGYNCSREHFEVLSQQLISNT